MSERDAEQRFAAFMDEMLSDLKAKADEHAAPVRAAIDRLLGEESGTGVIVTNNAPGCAGCGRPGVSAVRTETGWEGRCGEDGRCSDPLVAATLDAIDRTLAEEPKPGAIQLVEVSPRHAMTQNVPLAWEWKHPGEVVAVDMPTLVRREAPAPPDVVIANGSTLQVGDYVRIDWKIPDGYIMMPVWIEGEVKRVHRPKLDLVADVHIDRSNLMRVGSVETIGIERGARRIPRPNPAKAPVCDDPTDAREVPREMIEPWFTESLATDVQRARAQTFVQGLRERLGLPVPAPGPDDVLPAVQRQITSITLAAETALRFEETSYDGLGKAARDLGCTCRDVHNARSEDGVLEAQHDAGCVLRDWRIRARRGDLQVVGVDGVVMPAGEYTRMVYGEETAERLRERNNALALNAAAKGAADPLPRPSRPDGFSQAKIDEIKATMLASGKRTK